MKKFKSLYLTEAGRNVGHGHLKRAEALINILPNFEIDIFLETKFSDSTLNQFQKWSVDCLLEKYTPGYDIVFFDSFYGSNNFYLQLDRHPCVIYIDDYVKFPSKNGLIIDWTAGAEKRPLTTNHHCFGLDYLVTRSCFWEKKPLMSNLEKISSVAIIFGGADPLDMTSKIYCLMKNNKLLNTKFIGTFAYPSFEKFKFHPNFYWNLDDSKLANTLKSVDLVITAGGQVLYELASLGVPSVSIPIIDNQTDDIDGFVALGSTKRVLLEDLETLLDVINSLTVSEIKLMQVNCQKVSGKGEKLAKKINEFVNECLLNN